MQIKTVILTGLLNLALMGCSQTASAAPETYVIDSGHTHVSFTVDRFGFAKTLGVFPTSSGEITIDEDNPQSSTVSAKVATPDVWMGLAKRDEAVRSEFWLNTEKFKEISFVSTSVTPDEDDAKHAKVSGELTLLGQTKPVVFDVSLNQIGPDRTVGGTKAVGFSMSTIIKRSEFGNETAQKFVGDEVQINIETVAHLKKEN
jgi:polyisoprenoid-binding protein YceI